LKVAGVEQFAAGKPLNVSPVAWHDEHGLSHYGYVLADMTLQAFQALDKHCEGAKGLTLLEHDGDVAKTLGSVGLRINESAE
jgi:hypothetical protein